MKKFIGWLLFIIGVCGIIANIVFVIAWGSFPASLIINTLFCVVFILGGWVLAHPREQARGGMIR